MDFPAAWLAWDARRPLGTILGVIADKGGGGCQNIVYCMLSRCFSARLVGAVPGIGPGAHEKLPC